MCQFDFGKFFKPSHLYLEMDFTCSATVYLQACYPKNIKDHKEARDANEVFGSPVNFTGLRNIFVSTLVFITV